MSESDAEKNPMADVELSLENPEPRCPVVLLLDASTSMKGAKIDALNDGVDRLNYELRNDPLASLRVEIAMVAVGGRTARVLDVRGRGVPVAPTGDAFAPAGDFIPPKLDAFGVTPLGEGMRLALTLLRTRKEELRDRGLQIYRPWIVLISDGAPNDAGWEREAAAAVAAEQENRVAVYPIGVKDADMATLAQFSSRPPLKLRGLAFNDMFKWLSDSLRTVAQSQPGDTVQYQIPTWAAAWTDASA